VLQVYAEVEEVCGSNTAPSQSDVKQMHYLMACVHESARLLPSAPFLQRCSLQSDLKLGPGLIVPAGAILAAPVKLLQLDPVYWGNDSANFNPDRFLKPKSKCLLNAEEKPCIQNECDQTQKDATMSERRIFQAPASDSGFLTFGAGARSCIGSSFALTEIASLIMALIQRYEVWEFAHPWDLSLQNCQANIIDSYTD
jgi:cytochrome P450